MKNFIYLISSSSLNYFDSTLFSRYISYFAMVIKPYCNIQLIDMLRYRETRTCYGDANVISLKILHREQDWIWWSGTEDEPFISAVAFQFFSLSSPISCATPILPIYDSHLWLLYPFLRGVPDAGILAK